MFYCFTCDHYRDSNDEDHADYSGEDPVCGECVQNLEEQEFEQWVAAIDSDPVYINEQVK